MEANDAPLGTPGSLQLNFPGLNKALNGSVNRATEHRRQSGEAKPTSNMQFSSKFQANLAQNHDTGYDDAVSEVARNFSFGAARPGSHEVSKNQAQFRQSNARAPNNGALPIVQPGALRARRSQQFIPPSVKPHMTSAAPDAFQDSGSRNSRANGFVQPIQNEAAHVELQSRIFIQPAPQAPIAPIIRPQEPSPIAPYTEPPSESNKSKVAETFYEQDQIATDYMHDADYWTNEEEARSYYDGSAEGNTAEAGNAGMYAEQSQRDRLPENPGLSQDAIAGQVPLAGFPTGIMAHFEDYMRTHQQEAHDAEFRWKNATFEEWKAGKSEMMGHVKRIVDMTKNHMKRKLDACQSIYDDLDAQRGGLQKRRKILGALESDASKTGSDLMRRLIGK